VKLEIMLQANQESVDAAAWYNRKSSGVGEEFLNEVSAAFDRIEYRAESMTAWEWYTGRRDIRHCRLKRFPFAVIFELRPAECVVIAVSHLSRHPLYWLDRLN
jgi:hypothetical protein